jgi:hypothetical protein
MHTPTPRLPNNPNKIPNKSRNQIPTPPGRSVRPPSPPHVIPNNPKPPPKHLHNPIPNGRIVRIPVRKHHHRPVTRPVLIDSQPNPATLNPPLTHNPTVATSPKTACAKLRPKPT